MKKKVWIFNHYATNMYFEKGGRHYWFGKKLQARGYDVSVFCASAFHNRQDCVDTEGKSYVGLYGEDIPFIFVKTPLAQGNGLKRIRNMLAFYKNLFVACKLIVKKDGVPDIIIASSVHPLTMVAGIRLAKKFGIPCICEIRDLWPEAIFAFGKVRAKNLLGRILTTGEHWIYRHADALIFTKEGDVDYIKEHEWDTAQGGDICLSKCHYINNGVNTAQYDCQILQFPLQDADLMEEHAFNVIYVGAIRPVNNVTGLLDCAAVLKKYSDIRFLIYGEGSELLSLQERAAREKLNNVVFKGYVEKKYIPYILSRSAVNILNYSQAQYNWSRGNSSNKLFEYMASGKPIISTVKMGYSPIAHYSCGIELEEYTPQALAKTILSIKNMPADEIDRMGKNGRIAAENVFDYEILTNKLEAIIASVFE